MMATESSRTRAGRQIGGQRVDAEFVADQHGKPAAEGHQRRIEPTIWGRARTAWRNMPLVKFSPIAQPIST